MSFIFRTFACMKTKSIHIALLTTIEALLHVVSLLSAPLLLTAAILMAACSSDDSRDTPTPTNDKAEIAFTTATTTWHDATRATTYDNTTSEATLASFTCAAYNAGTTTAYIIPTAVNWNGEAWAFSDGKHYWPAEGSLDFFTYVPTTYVGDITYTASDNITFVCTNLPMTSTGQNEDLKEFVYAVTTGQNKTNAAAGVSLTFRHPFARIKFQLAANHKAITINSITFKSLKQSGTFTHPSTWATSGDAKNFVATINQAFTQQAVTQTIGTNYIMIPQTWSGAIEVEATWDDWGVSLKHTLSTTLPPITWAAGTSYTYTFTISETELIVNGTKYTEQW